MTTLILTEKPNVAKRIASILSGGAKAKREGKVYYYEFEMGGERYYVAPAAGHLLELDYPPGKWEYPSIVPPERLVLKEIKGKREYLKILEKLGKLSNRIIVATDLDSEGSSIALEIIKALNWEGKEILRMEFSSLTEEEIRSSFRDLKPFDYPRAYAGWVRRVIDLEWGANVSRGLTLSTRRKGWVRVLSSGRVQGPTLSMIVKREREIREFVPKKYYTVIVKVDKGFSLELAPPEGEERIWSHDYARRAAESVKDTLIARVKSDERKLSPPPPFDGTSLQVEVSAITGLTPRQIADRTSGIAQKLYEAGLISYIGTESQKYPKSWKKKDFVDMVKLIASYSPLKEEAESVLGDMREVAVEGKKDDPAHPTIHVVGVPEGRLEGKYREVYEIIARRNLATLAQDALIKRIRVESNVDGFIFRASGLSVLREGWLRVYPYARIEEFPEVEDGEELRVVEVEIEERETQPQKRYSHISLIKEMERLGLGTKNTRVQIIDILKSRGYLEEGSFKPTRLGEAIVEVLESFVPALTNPELTAKLERGMNEIELGKLDPSNFLRESLDELSVIMDEFKRNELEISERLYEGLKEYRSGSLGKCPECGGDLNVRESSYGYFIVCSNYPEKCDIKFNLFKNERFEGKFCECGLPLVSGRVNTKSNRGRRYIRCVANCDRTPLRCARCGGPMVARQGKFGVYLKCGNCGSTNFFRVRKH
jgi:DNA topoisomerase-1